MRFALVAGSSSLLIALATFACSSSSPPAESNEAEQATPKETTDTPPATDDTTPSNHNSNDNGNASSSGGTVPDGGDGGNNTSSSGGTTSSGGTPIDGGAAGTKCVSGSVQESEANDDVGTADEMPGQTGTFCGRIGANTDVDFISFTLPANAKSLSMSQSTTSGAIKIEPTADGEAFSFSGTYPFKPGKKYVIKVSTTAGALDYRIGVNITQ
jgi:hypothetical protein